MSLTDNGSEYITAAGKAAPSLAVTGATVAGYSLQDWVMILTALYTAVQLGLLIFDRWKKYRDGC